MRVQAERHPGRRTVIVMAPAQWCGRGGWREVVVDSTDADVVEAEFSPESTSVRAARRFVLDTLDSWAAVHADDIVLLASELATNAVIHARSTYRITVRRMMNKIRVDVDDTSDVRPARRHYEATSGTGRGLALVAELALDWGVEPLATGKRVWFTVATTPTASGGREDKADDSRERVVDLDHVLAEHPADDDRPRSCSIARPIAA
jgi:anti-sigma regulatory factor (Ser/Thr protein kinase)